MATLLNSDISQGRVVTQLRCGGIINKGFVVNLLVNLPVKEFWKSVNIWRSYGQYHSGVFFLLTHGVYNVPPRRRQASGKFLLTCVERCRCSNEAKMRNPLKFAGVPQTRQQISAISGPKFTILWGHVEEIFLFNHFFPIVDAYLKCKDIAGQIVRWCPDSDFSEIFCVLYFQRAACNIF